VGFKQWSLSFPSVFEIKQLRKNLIFFFFSEKKTRIDTHICAIESLMTLPVPLGRKDKFQ
jgi:hypothetical protein